MPRQLHQRHINLVNRHVICDAYHTGVPNISLIAQTPRDQYASKLWSTNPQHSLLSIDLRKPPFLDNPGRDNFLRWRVSKIRWNHNHSTRNNSSSHTVLRIHTSVLSTIQGKSATTHRQDSDQKSNYLFPPLKNIKCSKVPALSFSSC